VGDGPGSAPIIYKQTVAGGAEQCQPGWRAGGNSVGSRKDIVKVDEKLRHSISLEQVDVQMADQQAAQREAKVMLLPFWITIERWLG